MEGPFKSVIGGEGGVGGNRLVLLLNNVVRDYEKKFGPLDAEGRRQDESTLG